MTSIEEDYTIDAQVLRPEVGAYAQSMECQLRAHDDRPGWKRDDAADLYSHLLEEVVELGLAICMPTQRLRRCFDSAARRVISRGNADASRPAVRREAADVGNMAMMVADVWGALPLPEPVVPSAALHQALEVPT